MSGFMIPGWDIPAPVRRSIRVGDRVRMEAAWGAPSGVGTVREVDLNLYFVAVARDGDGYWHWHYPPEAVAPLAPAADGFTIPGWDLT